MQHDPVIRSRPTVVLTGATSGIGRATALLLAPDAGCLILHGRQPEDRVEVLLHELRLAMPPGARLHYVRADYSDLAQVERLAGDIRALTDRIDLLINNAGCAGPPRRTLTASGNEVTFQVNYLAPVALTNALADLVGAASPGRIINIASATHYSAQLQLDDLTFARSRYDAYDAYAHSKLAMVTWSCWLAAHRPNASADIVSMHPGAIATKLMRAMFATGGDRPESAAGYIRFVASQRHDNGTYYDKRRPVPPNPQAVDRKVQERLHEITVQLLAGSRDDGPERIIARPH